MKEGKEVRYVSRSSEKPEPKVTAPQIQHTQYRDRQRRNDANSNTSLTGTRWANFDHPGPGYKTFDPNIYVMSRH